MALVCSGLALLIATACAEQPQTVATNSAPAVAQSVPVQPYNATAAKHAAILGAPSALQRMLMQQSGSAPASAPVVEQASLTPAAGGSTYPVRPAIIQYGPAGPIGLSAAPASSDRPDIFGTSALRVDRTQLDAKWRRVTASFSSAVPISRQLAGQAEGAMDKLALVNGWVNRRIQFVNDIRSSGQADLWSGAAETISRGQGDCEDYAITKLQLLKALGFADDDLYLAVVKDLVRHADHAVLVVRVDGRFVVLDNNVDRVLDTEEVADYRPLITYAASGKAWIHGYRQQHPVQLASATVASTPSN